MTNPKNKYLALLAKVAIAGLSRVWDFIQDVLLEWMLPPIERTVGWLSAYIKKRLPAKRPKRKRKKPSFKEKLVKRLPSVRRVALVTVAVLVLLLVGWSLFAAAAHLFRSQEQSAIQPIVSASANSRQCAIPPIVKRTSNTVAGSGDSSPCENDPAVSSTGMAPSHTTAVFVQKGRRKISLQTYTHHKRFDDCLRGISVDVSNHQTSIDWQRVAATEVNAAMVRVGYRGTGSGRIFADESYINNINGALRNGLPVGAYFYSQAITPEEAREEAEFMIEKIAGYLITLPVAIDFEFACANDGSLTGRLYNAQLSKEETTRIAEAFCDKIASAGYTPMVYGNDDMLSRKMYVDRLSKKYRIWLASYHRKAVYEGEYFFWQFTNQGVVDGIDGNVCLDYWYR